MNIHEYQGKQLLERYGVSVPAGEVCSSVEEVRKVAERLVAGGAGMLVVITSNWA